VVWQGAEVIFELYEKTSQTQGQGARASDWFVRVLWGGKPMQTSLPAPLDILDMVSWEALELYLNELIGTPQNVYDFCNTL
jgi:hypothetical protein